MSSEAAPYEPYHGLPTARDLAPEPWVHCCLPGASWEQRGHRGHAPAAKTTAPEYLLSHATATRTKQHNNMHNNILSRMRVTWKWNVTLSKGGILKTPENEKKKRWVVRESKHEPLSQTWRENRRRLSMSQTAMRLVIRTPRSISWTMANHTPPADHALRLHQEGPLGLQPW